MSDLPPAPGPPGQSYQPPGPSMSGYPVDAVRGQRANFGPRFVAMLIDGLIGFAVQLVPFVMLFLGPLVVFAASEILGIILLLLGLVLYLLVLVAWLVIIFGGMAKDGQTPGKRHQGIKVVKVDGSQIGLGGAIGRFFMQWLTNLPLYLGSLWMLWDEEQRTLYDKMLDMDAVMVEKGSIFPLFPGGKPF